MSVSHPAIVLCYGHRGDAREYWFGLYKLTATADGTTVWYDGNPSTSETGPARNLTRIPYAFVTKQTASETVTAAARITTLARKLPVISVL